MNQLKKKSIRSAIPVIIILLVFAGAMFVPAVPAITAYLKQPVDLDDVDYDGDLDGLYVSGTIYYIYDWYCDTTEEGSNKQISREYIIDAGDNYYMGMLVRKAKMDQAEDLMAACWEYEDNVYSGIDDDGSGIYATQYKVRGTIVEMPRDSRKYYYQYLDEAGLSGEQQAMFLPYYLEVGKVGADQESGNLFFLIISAILIVIAVMVLVRALLGSGLKQVRQYIANSANPESTRERVDAFLAETENDGSLRFNREFICGNIPQSVVFQEVKNLVWAYQKTVTHKRNFITVGHSYYVVLGFKDGKRYEITMKNEDEALKSLAALDTTFPSVVVGYNKDLDNLFRKNMPEFLNIKYNQAQTDNF